MMEMKSPPTTTAGSKAALDPSHNTSATRCEWAWWDIIMEPTLKKVCGKLSDMGSISKKKYRFHPHFNCFYFASFALGAKIALNKMSFKKWCEITLSNRDKWKCSEKKGFDPVSVFKQTERPEQNGWPKFCSYMFFPKATQSLQIPRSFIRAEAEQYLILVRRLLLESKRDDTAPTFISSGHNLTFQAQMLQLGFQLQSKSVLCIKGQDRVLDCELQEYKYFLAIGLLLSGVSSKPTIVAPTVSDSDFPISFWITGNTSLCKEHMHLLKYQFVSRCDYLRSVWEPCRDSGLGMN